jgi:hypothetical protein
MAGLDERSGCWAKTGLEALITSPSAINPMVFNIALLLSSELPFAVGVPSGDQSNEKEMPINIDLRSEKPQRRRIGSSTALVALRRCPGGQSLQEAFPAFCENVEHRRFYELL